MRRRLPCVFFSPLTHLIKLIGKWKIIYCFALLCFEPSPRFRCSPLHSTQISLQLGLLHQIDKEQHLPVPWKLDNAPALLLLPLPFWTMEICFFSSSSGAWDSLECAAAREPPSALEQGEVVLLVVMGGERAWQWECVGGKEVLFHMHTSERQVVMWTTMFYFCSLEDEEEDAVKVSLIKNAAPPFFFSFFCSHCAILCWHLLECMGWCLPLMHRKASCGGRTEMPVSCWLLLNSNAAPSWPLVRHLAVMDVFPALRFHMWQGPFGRRVLSCAACEALLVQRGLISTEPPVDLQALLFNYSFHN